jgi:uncharacterized protein with HEPN domain
VSRHDKQRLEDIAAAISAIAAHLKRGDLSDGLVFDAVRVRLIEIGEAVKALPQNLLTSEDQIPWADIARMRDLLSHRYFDTSHSIEEEVGWPAGTSNRHAGRASTRGANEPTG